MTDLFKKWKGFLIQVLIVMSLLASTTGCSGLKTKDQIHRLETSLEQYSAAFRWGRFREAYSFHVTRNEKTPEVDLEKMDNFSVTGMNIIRNDINPEGTEADLLIEINYYDEQYGTLRKIKQQQLWWFHKELKRWFTEADFPDFK